MPVLNRRPSLTTERLHLRPFRTSDAGRVRLLAGERDVASTALNIPHPFERGMGERWIASHQRLWQEGHAAIFAIVVEYGAETVENGTVEDVDRDVGPNADRDFGELAGAIGLTIERRHLSGEIGYWLGRRYWGCGYATEAAAEIVRFAFDEMELNRVHANHFATNPASGRVLQKIGMRREGLLREAVHHWGQFEDLVVWSILHDEYDDTVRR